MILSALAGLYERTVGKPDGPPAFGYAEVGVVGALVIDDAGQLTEILPLEYPVKVGRTEKLVPQRMSVPQPPTRTVGVRAGFLCDNAAYLLGFDGKGRPERVRTQFMAAKTLHERLLADIDDPAANAVRAFFAIWTPEDAADRLSAEREQYRTGWLVFSHNGAYLHRVPAIRSAWERYVAESDAPRGQCLVTGAAGVPIARIHPFIKGVPGAQSSGAALISFNQDAFTSYGKSQNLNAPVSEQTAFAYTTALNHLLRRDSSQRLQLGDTTVVLWAARETPAERTFAAMLGGRADAKIQAEVKDSLGAIAAGRWTDEPDLAAANDVRFYVLGLSPNAARLQLRFFLTDTLGEFLKRLQQHCRDVLFERAEAGTKVPTFWQLAQELLPKDRDGKIRADEGAKKSVNKLQAELLRAVLSGQDYPQSLLPRLLERLRTDRGYTAERLGLVKACFNRSFRTRAAELKMKEIEVDLDEANAQPGYLLGRLFALLERMQEISRGINSGGRRKAAAGSGAGEAGEVGLREAGRSPTIRDRFAAAASVTPRAVFPHLLSLKAAHEKKAKRDAPGFAHALAQDIGKLVARFDSNIGFPSQLDLHQQGLFFIGYYQQRQAFFVKRAGGGDNPENDVLAAEA